MGVSKVEFGDETLIDLTNDTVNENNLLEGATAHGADGEEINGSVVVTDDYEELNNHPLVNGVELIGDKTSDDLKITWHGTRAEYDAITDKDENTLYIIEDEELIATTEQLGLVKPDGTTITIEEDGTISTNNKTRILELNSPLSEIGILNTLVNNEGYECSGFFYNTDKSVYCEFEGLYSGHTISGETVHFGYCHIRGIHNSQYSADYYIDDEDGSTWYKKVPIDYLAVDSETSETSTNLIQNQAVSKKLAMRISYADYLNLSSAEKNNGRPYYVYDYPDGLNIIDDTANNKTRVWSSEKSTSETTAIKNNLQTLSLVEDPGENTLRNLCDYYCDNNTWIPSKKTRVFNWGLNMGSYNDYVIATITNVGNGVFIGTLDSIYGDSFRHLRYVRGQEPIVKTISMS